MSLVIAFEGIDGSGKSTLARMLAQKINKEKVQFIDKNSDRPIRKIYRELMKNDEFISDALSLFLGLADYKYTEERVEDRSKEFIIYDRCFLSTLVDVMSLGLISSEDMPLYMGMFRMPDIIYFIDADALQVLPEKKDISLAEAGGKISSPAELVDGFIEYQNRNYQGYLSLFEKYVETEVFRVRRDSVESSLDQIFCHFSSFIKNRFSQEFEDICQAEQD